MHRICFAPVLSATLSRDSCWIIFSSPDRSSLAAWAELRLVRHLARSRTSTTRQRLLADSGLVSMMRTRSPIPHWFCSSCAFSLLVRRSTLPYSACLTRSSTDTTTVLSILSLTTRPSRVLRRLRVSSIALVSVTLPASLMLWPHSFGGLVVIRGQPGGDAEL